MKRGAFLTLLALVALCTQGLVPVAGAAPAAGSTLAEHRPGVVLVGFQPGASASDRAAALRAVGAAASEQLSPLTPDARVVHLGAMSVEAAIDALQRARGVRYAEPDYIVHALDVSNDPQYLAGALWGMYGDSTIPAYQFGSQADQAWAAGKIGSRTVYVGIIDSGMRWDHADLAANVGNPNEIAGNGKDDDGNGKVDDTYGYDFSSPAGDSNPDDANGHGTHVAGTIGAVGGNGIGVAGVAWRVRMLSGKFLGADGSGSTADAVKAVDYFTQLKGLGLNIVATNNSWGGGAESQSLLEAINRGGDAGILFIAAAGNDNADTDATASYPSNYSCTTPQRTWDCVVSVAATTVTGGRASFSNYGATTVDLGAPGQSILSTSSGGGYVTMSGTSMASPHVTGAVALCASMGNLAPDEIRSAILSSARATTSLSGKTATGGRLDVGGLVGPCTRSASSAGRTPVFATSVAFSGIGSGTVAFRGGGTCSSGCSENRTGAVFLIGQPATGSKVSWTGCATTGPVSGSPDAVYCLVYATQARNVTATFTLLTYAFSLTLTKPSGTSPTVSISTSGTNATSWTTTCKSSCKNSALRYGTVVTLTANPVTGATAFTWAASGCDSIFGRTCTVTVNGTESVSIAFRA